MRDIWKVAGAAAAGSYVGTKLAQSRPSSPGDSDGSGCAIVMGVILVMIPVFATIMLGNTIAFAIGDTIQVQYPIQEAWEGHYTHPATSFTEGLLGTADSWGCYVFSGLIVIGLGVAIWYRFVYLPDHPSPDPQIESSEHVRPIGLFALPERPRGPRRGGQHGRGAE